MVFIAATSNHKYVNFISNNLKKHKEDQNY